MAAELLRGSFSMLAMAASFCILCVMLAASVCECTAEYKNQQITVYVRDILNTTDFMTVPGVSDMALTGSTAPYGSVFTVNDPVYESIPSQEVAFTADDKAIVGSFRGTATFVSFEGYDMFLQVSLRLQSPLPEGTVVIMGVVSYANRANHVAVIGGTGAFLSASGHATLAAIDEVPGDDQTLRLDLNLYMPTALRPMTYACDA